MIIKTRGALQSTIFIAMAVAIFTSCKKENEQDPIVILTSKTWKFAKVDRSGGNHVDLPFNMVSDCQKDDTFEFKNDGEFVTFSNALKCSIDEPANTVSNYAYNKATKELIIGGVKCQVVALTKDQLKYTAPISYSTGYVNVIFILE